MQERPDPCSGPGRCASRSPPPAINFADVMARMGLYPDAPKTPCVVGYEVAGTILERGGGRRGPRSPASACSRARSSAATPRRSSCPPDDVVPLPGPAELRAGRRDPRQLRDRLGGADRLRQPAAGRARARPLRRRRRRHRRHADRQALRRRGLRHRVARQARADAASSASTTRSTTPSPAGSAGSPQVRRDHGRRRRQELQAQLRPAAPGRAAGRVRRLVGRLRRDEKHRHGAAKRWLRMPRFNMVKQMRESKAVIGLNMLTPVEGPRDAASRGSSRCASCSTTDGRARRRGRAQLRRGRRGAQR